MQDVSWSHIYCAFVYLDGIFVFRRLQVTLKEEQSSYFNELLTQVNTWMSSMERRIDNLDPVAMDIQLIEDQIESIQVCSCYTIIVFVLKMFCLSLGISWGA